MRSAFLPGSSDATLPFICPPLPSELCPGSIVVVGQNKKSVRLQLIMSAACQRWYHHWPLNNGSAEHGHFSFFLCVCLCLRQCRTNEKIECECWIYKYPLQRESGFVLPFPPQKKRITPLLTTWRTRSNLAQLIFNYSFQRSKQTKSLLWRVRACVHIADCFHMAPFWTAIGGGEAAAQSTGWDCDGRIWGLCCGFPLLLAGDFSQTLVCRTRTNLEWPVAAEKNWPPEAAH